MLSRIETAPNREVAFSPGPNRPTSDWRATVKRTPKKRPELERFNEKFTVEPDGCWMWSHPNPHGYGRFYIGPHDVMAHRYSYELFCGPIGRKPLDHLCHTESVERGECDGGEACPHRACVNPEHLEVVSFQENSGRGVNSYTGRTMCRSGRHDITLVGAIFIGPNGRQCNECAKEGRRRRQNLSRLKARRELTSSVHTLDGDGLKAVSGSDRTHTRSTGLEAQRGSSDE